MSGEGKSVSFKTMNTQSKEKQMDVALILHTDGVPVGMKVTDLEHLIRIIKFQSEEKGLNIFSYNISGNIVIK
jgi:hypothetical protein